MMAGFPLVYFPANRLFGESWEGRIPGLIAVEFVRLACELLNHSHAGSTMAS